MTGVRSKVAEKNCKLVVYAGISNGVCPRAMRSSL